MNLHWLYQLSQRRNALFIPVFLFIVLAVMNIAGYLLNDGGLAQAEMSQRRLVGTLLLYNLLPPYLVFALVILGQRSLNALQTLEANTTESAAEPLRRKLLRVHPLCYLTMILGLAFGASQNSRIVSNILSGVGFSTLDIVFVLGNCLIWVLVSLLLTWRIPAAIELSRFGATLNLDLFRLDYLKPFTRVPTTDILIVAGALTMMPLQALDAEFRLGNYQAGLIVGALSALILFIIPMLGLRTNIKSHKEKELALLRGRLDDVDRNNLSQLNTLLSHIDRIQAIPAWPIDIKLVSKIAATVVIPPMAWVAAALVENLIDAL